MPPHAAPRGDGYSWRGDEALDNMKEVGVAPEGRQQARNAAVLGALAELRQPDHQGIKSGKDGLES